MIHVNEMRAYLLKQYPGERWRLKVLYMPEAQVIAIYLRMVRK